MAASFSYSGSSRSRSIAFRRYLSITFWYAPAVAFGSPQVWPSLVPAYPPVETETSPPAARIDLMTAATFVSDETGPVPSQVGVQPPLVGARMNANWNAFWPVADITAFTSGGSLSSGIRYGADAYQALPSRPWGGLAALAWVMPTTAAPTTTAAVIEAMGASFGLYNGFSFRGTPRTTRAQRRTRDRIGSLPPGPREWERGRVRPGGKATRYRAVQGR